MQINNFKQSKVIKISTLLILSLMIFFTSCTSTNFKDRTWPDDYVINEQYSEFISDAESYLERIRFSGTILLSKGEDIIYAKGFGPSDKKNPDSPTNTIHTTYEVGSITKQFTAVAILQLVDEGKLSLDDPLTKFFPYFTRGKNITIRMLLSNKSGLADFFKNPYVYFPYEVAVELDKAHADGKNNEVNRYIVLDYLNYDSIQGEPNIKYIDCDTNYYLLGVIVEQVTGMKYEDYIDAFVFDKAGMNCSNLDYQGTTAKGYNYSEVYFSIPKGLSLACNDMNSCVVDLFKWNYSLAHGNIISQDLFYEMMNNNYGLNHDATSIISIGMTDVFNSYNKYYINEEVSLIVFSNEPISVNSAANIASKLSVKFLEFEKVHNMQKK